MLDNLEVVEVAVSPARGVVQVRLVKDMMVELVSTSTAVVVEVRVRLVILEMAVLVQGVMAAEVTHHQLQGRQLLTLVEAVVPMDRTSAAVAMEVAVEEVLAVLQIHPQTVTHLIMEVEVGVTYLQWVIDLEMVIKEL
jgi:hypothetical protein